jgi:hypothetical protein
MANADRPVGFRPYGRALRETPYSAGGTVYPGDAVKLNSSGQCVVVAAGDSMLGVAASYATSGNTVIVWDHPDQQFTGQVDGLSVAQTHVGNNADVLATSGSSTYKQSRMEIDGSTAVTTTAGVRILAIDPTLGNAAGSNADVVFVINEHILRETAGV